MIKKELNTEQGRRLIECIKIARVTQKELAKDTNYTPQHISNIVTSKRNMSTEAARTFSKYLGVREEYLLCEDSFRTGQEELYHFNSSSSTACDITLKYLESIGIDIMPVIPAPYTSEINEQEKSEFCDTTIVDGDGTEYLLRKFPSLKTSMHKDMTAFIYQHFPQGSPLLFFVELKGKKCFILTINEFGRLLKEVDSYAFFSANNFLEKHIDPQEHHQQDNKKKHSIFP